MAKNYYETLGVPKSADEKAIKTAYRQLARKYHPDVNPNNAQAEAKFKEIQEAYDVLSDPEKRKLYDQFGSNWEQVQNGAGPFQGDFSNVEFNFGGGGFGSLFENLFGGAQGADVAYGMGVPSDVEYEVTIPLAEIATGTKRKITYQTMDQERNRGGVSVVPTTKTVEVTIPAGIRDGARLRVAGKGQAGINGRSGDLYVVVKWAPQPGFRWENEQLVTDVAVPFTVAALGGEVSIATLDSRVTVKVPPGTQSGQSLKLSGKGIPTLSGQRGDLLAKVKITVPKTLTDHQRDLFRQLQTALEGGAQ